MIAEGAAIDRLSAASEAENLARPLGAGPIFVSGIGQMRGLASERDSAQTELDHIRAEIALLTSVRGAL